jgi:hypothetical protein
MGTQVRFPSPVKDWNALIAQTRPASADQPEVIPWVFYGTQDFASSWTSVNFFSTVQNDQTLSNIEQPNQLPAEQFFELHYIGFEFFPPDQASTTAFADDVRAILYEARAWVQFSLSNKLYGQYPLSHLNPPGGLVNNIAGTPAANALAASPKIGSIGAGMWVNGAISIPPKQTFNVRVLGNAAVLSATVQGRMSLHGNLYRRVL